MSDAAAAPGQPALRVPFEWLPLEADPLAHLLEGEAPRVVATVFASRPERWREGRTAVATQEAVLRALATGDVATESAEIREIEARLWSRMHDGPLTGTRPADPDLVAEFLCTMRRGVRRDCIARLKAIDTEAAAAVRARILELDDLAGLTDPDMRRLLDDVGVDGIANALRHAPVDVQEAFLARSREERHLRARIEQGAHSAYNERWATSHILKAARQLIEDGSIEWPMARDD